jgi:hypothetical protein
MGCNYEFHSLRTLTDMGERTTVLTVKALYDCTHSYIVMPVLQKDGSIFPKILICFQEKDGKFGPIVSKSIVNRDNIIITCSRSGKLSKSHMKWW